MTTKRIFLLYIFLFMLVFLGCGQMPLSSTDSSTTTDSIFTTEPSSTLNERTTFIDDHTDALIESMIGSMTIEEKVGQMIQAERGNISPGEVREYNIGSVLSGGGSHPRSWTDDYDAWYEMVASYQDAALQSSSGIPIIYGIDAVHGNNNIFGSTIFPHNINLGMINDPELVYEIGQATAREVKSAGIHWNFSPAVSVAKNIRWGRTYESFSENPDIHRNLVGPFIEGLQDEYVIATAKHYLADGATQHGIDQGNAVISEEEAREQHLESYIHAIDAGVSSIMVSFSSINGDKMTGNAYWITEVLKEELAFKGVVLSDWNAVHQLNGSFYEQIVTAVNAGIDMMMEPTHWRQAYGELLLAVNNGDVSIGRIDDAVYRVLAVKHKHGVFAQPYQRLDPNDNVYTVSHRQLALEAAIKSFVLLKNDRDALPLSGDENIYLEGPGSDHVGFLCGGWTSFWQGNTNDDIGVGTSIRGGLDELMDQQRGRIVSDVGKADVMVAVFTEAPYAEGQGDTSAPTLTCGLSHPDNEITLQRAIEAKNKGIKTIGILISGRPLVLGDALEAFDAFFAVFLPGSEGGDAVARVLLGQADFSGKLAFTWPTDVHSLENISTRDNYASLEKAFPFGYGLTYNED